MRYGLLLRGINVGKSVRVEMRRLKELLIDLNCSRVVTYINSGNAWFEHSDSAAELSRVLAARIEAEFGHAIATLVKTHDDLVTIAQQIPQEWLNDDEQRTDVAYLFPSADSPDIVSTLPLNPELVAVRYTPGALIWNYHRENASRSRLNKLIDHDHYGAMTIRNVNTARKMATWPEPV